MMVTKVRAVIAAATVAGALLLGGGSASAVEPGTVGTTDSVATGQPYHVYGSCVVYPGKDGDPTTYAVVCVPEVSADGAELVRSDSDGSALYADNTTFDPEDLKFYPVS